MKLDRDLESIQLVRNLVARAVKAQQELMNMPPESLDRIAKAIADAGAQNAEMLAKMAVEETGFGNWQDKTLKNILGSTMTWDS